MTEEKEEGPTFASSHASIAIKTCSSVRQSRWTKMRGQGSLTSDLDDLQSSVEVPLVRIAERVAEDPNALRVLPR